MLTLITLLFRSSGKIPLSVSSVLQFVSLVFNFFDFDFLSVHIIVRCKNSSLLPLRVRIGEFRRREEGESEGFERELLCLANQLIEPALFDLPNDRRHAPFCVELTCSAYPAGDWFLIVVPNLAFAFDHHLSLEPAPDKS